MWSCAAKAMRALPSVEANKGAYSSLPEKPAFPTFPQEGVERGGLDSEEMGEEQQAAYTSLFVRAGTDIKTQH